MGALVASLRSYMVEILQSRDFESIDRDGYLIGKKGTLEVAFCLIGAGEAGNLPAFLDSFKTFKGKKVIVALEPLPEVPPERLDQNIIVWDREAVEREIGRLHVERLVGEKDHSLVDELVADDYPRMVSSEELERLQSTEVGDRIIRPIIDVGDVREIGMRTVGGFRHRLELVPYHLYSYSCALYLGDAKVGEEKGSVAINELTRKAEPWTGNLDVVYALEVTHQRLEPTIDADTARALARQEVLRMHTSEREVVHDEGHTTLTEKKKVAPRESDITLEDRGVFYLPIWCVEGVHGVLIINAGTGKIMSEDYYKM
jgi:hypothetical protein